MTILWPPSDNIIVAVVAVVGSTLAAWWSAHVQKRIKSVDAQTAGLSAQMTGWIELTKQLQETIASLRKQLYEAEKLCKEKIDQLEFEMHEKDEGCHRRITELEERLRRYS